MLTFDGCDFIFESQLDWIDPLSRDWWYLESLFCSQKSSQGRLDAER